MRGNVVVSTALARYNPLVARFEMETIGILRDK
jgi:hypothetical protein